MDDDPEEGVMLRSDFTLTTQIHRTASFLFSLPSRITEARVRYYLEGILLYDTIWEFLAYDTILCFLHVRYQSQSHRYYDT